MTEEQAELNRRAERLLREHARSVIQDAENRGGFKDHRQLDDLKDCLSGLKAILRMEAEAGTGNGTQAKKLLA